MNLSRVRRRVQPSPEMLVTVSENQPGLGSLVGSNRTVFQPSTNISGTRSVKTLQIKHQSQKFRGYREYIDDTPLEMVLIPDGTFTMGAPEDEEGSSSRERPQHDVTISAFLMGRYPITQAQWRAVCEAVPSASASRTDLKVELDLDPDPSRFKEPYQGIDRWQRPVETVNWYEAVEFCQRLSKLTGRNYRLPSEAEWEYACRGVREPLAPVQSQKEESIQNPKSKIQNLQYPPFHFGETITTKLANYRGEKSYGKGSKGEYRHETTPVGYFKVVNPFGLSDLHGQVWEWCADTWHENYEGAPTDGSVWTKGGNENRSPLRGGSWYDQPGNCRSASRYSYGRRGSHVSHYGFRVVCGFGKAL